MTREVRELVQDLERNGWRVKQGSGKHLKLVSPAGKIVTLSRTPSDHRSMQNTLAQCRRALR